MEPLHITGRTVFPDGIRNSRIGMDPIAGTIVSVDDMEEQQSDNVLIFPGFIDAHVHAREYPKPLESDSPALTKWEAACRKEVFTTAGQAAINGGVTLIAAMPNDPVPPDNPQRYSQKVHLAASSPCPIVTFACVTRDSSPWADIPYKVYLDSAPSTVSFDNWDELADTLSRYKGRRVFFHAEDPLVLHKFPSGGPRWKNRPPAAEVSAVRRILEMTAKFGLKTHICHISTEQAVMLVQDYNRNSSLNVTCEATPHHLFFSIRDGRVIAADGNEIQNPNHLECNPPLRPEHDRLFLVDALKNGLVDILASDHAPHTIQDKMNAAPGMPHLDTLGPFVGWLMADCGFVPQRIAEITALIPGRLFAPDLAVPQGSIAEGWTASFTTLDLDRRSVADDRGIQGRGPFKTRCGWSPFSGFSFPAYVSATIVAGRPHRF